MSKNNPRREFYAALAGLAALVLAGCNRGEEAKAGAPPPVPVQMAQAVQQDMPRIIESIGNVQSIRSVAIKSQVDGIIAEIHFHEGDEVKVGDLLVSLDRRPFENSLRIARADLANARAEATQAAADAERYTHLDQSAAISKEQFAQILTKAETTKALVLAKEAAVANADLQFGYSEIRAPIAGRTGQLVLHEGALVKANDVNQSILSINQLAPISVAYSVPEDALGAIRAALAAQRSAVTVMESTTSTRPLADGKLEFVDNAVDPATATITLKAVFDNADHALWPGQFVHVHTQVDVDRGVVVIPSSAVQTSQKGSQVFVVKPDRSVELRAVKIARAADDSTIIAEGVRGGETVVTDGQLRLVPGAQVEARTVAGAPVTEKAPAGGGTP
jgi:multidrug efflux system membrane fusion protein